MAGAETRPKTELGNYEPVYTTELIENNWPAGYARLETRSGHKSLIIRRIKRRGEDANNDGHLSWSVEGRIKWPGIGKIKKSRQRLEETEGNRFI